MKRIKKYYAELTLYSFFSAMMYILANTENNALKIISCSFGVLSFVFGTLLVVAKFIDNYLYK